jgi:hypothetical protein
MFGRLLPQPGERDAFSNILQVLALPLLAYLVLALVDARTYYLELPVLTDRAATLRVIVDVGNQAAQLPVLEASLVASAAPQIAHFQLPLCRLEQVMLDAHAPAAVEIGPVTFSSAVEDLTGLQRNDKMFAAADLQLPSAAQAGPSRWVGFRPLAHIPGTAESGLALPLARPLVLGFNWSGFLLAAVLAGAEYVLLSLGALLAWRRVRHWPPGRHALRSASFAGERWWRAGASAARRHPVAAIWLAAAFGVAASCYPVLFFGKSFVSPNTGTPLLYDAMPTLPGYTEASNSEPQGSDVLATMTAFVPYTLVQRHALIDDHEFPIFDRYSQCGLPLLAQGQTMIGDPFHVLMLLAGANAWEWDLRFLFSRLLFAAGIGLIVRLTTRQVAIASLLAFAACFLGFFGYRLNHPTYFCLCYAPWILYAWLRLPEAGRGREAAPWIGLLLAANWLEINAGPIKDAYLLAAALNVTGALAFLCSVAQPPGRRWRMLALVVWCQVLLILISNPFWVSTVDLIVHSWNAYLTPRVWQIQPSLLIGFFDDIFYRQFEAAERQISPGTNFLVFLGLAYAVSDGKTLLRNRTFLAVGLGAAGAAAVTFGVVPPALMERVPFLGNIMHVDDVFSTILIVPAIVLAGFGLAECRRRLNRPDWLMDHAAAVAVLVGLTALFLGVTQAQQRSAIHNLGYHEEVVKSFFFWCDAAALSVAFVALPMLVRVFLRRDGRQKWGIVPWLALCLVAMLWRQGQQLHFTAAFDRYVIEPQVRVDLRAPSPAVDFIHRDSTQPSRTIGMRNNLFPGTSGMFGLESISGPDALLLPAYHNLLAAMFPLVWGWRPLIDEGNVGRCQALFNMLNVRYFLASPSAPGIDVPGVSRVARMDLDVFASQDAWPRAFYTSALSTWSSPRDFFSQLSHDGRRPFALRDINLSAADLPAGTSSLPAGQAARVVVPATDYRLTNNSTTFRVRAPGPGIITLTEVYDGANKQVTVNGRPAAHFPVNMAFEGIYVDRAGDYTVSVRSWPRYLTAGLYVSALGILLLIGTAAFIYWPVRRQEEPVDTPTRELAGLQSL